MNMKFEKWSGSGNDFILVNNMDLSYNLHDFQHHIPKICSRNVSVGADGFIMLEPVEGADFKWHFFNSDGSSAEMCANGSRCAARFAFMHGIAGKSMTFKTIAGLIEAEILEGDKVKVKLTEPTGLNLDKTADLTDKYKEYSFVNTGVPHTVIFGKNFTPEDVFESGRVIRNHSIFAPKGTNVNFVEPLPDNTLFVRTYERGVEHETLACGTGAVASALIAMKKGLVRTPVNVKTTGGLFLKIYLEENATYIEGEARRLVIGEIQPESLTY